MVASTSTDGARCGREVSNEERAARDQEPRRRLGNAYQRALEIAMLGGGSTDTRCAGGTGRGGMTDRELLEEALAIVGEVSVAVSCLERAIGLQLVRLSGRLGEKRWPTRVCGSCARTTMGGDATRS